MVTTGLSSVRLARATSGVDILDFNIIIKLFFFKGGGQINMYNMV